MDWRAVALELIPLTALIPLALFDWSPAAIVTALGLGLLSGAGWWRLGYRKLGLWIALLRGAVLVVLLNLAINASMREAYFSDSGSVLELDATGLTFLAGSFFLVTVLCSATFVARASKRRQAAQPSAG